jgi:hypothetical protein
MARNLLIFRVMVNTCFEKESTSMRRFLIGLALFASIGFANWARAGVIFDNYNQSTSGSQVVDGGNVNGWFAQAFATTATDVTLTDVALKAVNSDINTAFTVGIYSSVAGSSLNEPGSLIQLIYSGTPGQFFDPFDINGLNVSLSPSTEYFVLIAPTVGELSWSYTNATSALNSNSTDSGANWSSVNTAPFQMTVTAVPEPATMQLLVSGAVLAAVRRVVRKRAARA